MDENKLERLLLLEQSGELSPAQRRRLDAELAASAEARQARGRLRGLAAVLPPPAGEPAPGAARRIAARLGSAPAASPPGWPAWKPALAAAAALAILLGAFFFRAAPHPAGEPALAAVEAEVEDWTDPLDAEFAELENLLLSISTDDALDVTEL